MRAERYSGLEKRLIVVESGPDGRVDLTALLRSLREEGIRALLCEGGPTLHGALQAVGLVDELFLTIAPKLIGGEAPRIVEGALPETAELELAWLLEQDGELFARYRQPPADFVFVRPIWTTKREVTELPLAFGRPSPEERTAVDGLHAQPPGRDPARAHPRLHGRGDLPAGAGDHGGARRRGRPPASPTRRSWSRSARRRRARGSGTSSCRTSASGRA